MATRYCSGASTMRRQLILVTTVLALIAIAMSFAMVERTDDAVPVLEIQRKVFHQRVTADGVLEAVRTTPLSAPPRTQGPAKIAWMAEDGIFAKQGDIIVRFDPMESERELIEGELALSTARSKIEQNETQTEATLNDVERDRHLAQYELDSAQSFANKDPDIFSRVEIIEAQIDEELAGLKLEHAEGRADIQQAISSFDLEMFGIERTQAEIKIERANKALDALEVRAPHDGIVIFVRDWRGNIKQVGDVVYSQQAIAELPALDIMKADIHVLEADAGGLEEGRPATLVVEASQEKSFDATIGHVDRMPKPKVRGVPVQYFSVTLALTETDPVIMKPGQRVRATLFLAERDDALVVPRQAVFDDDGRKLVYRQTSKGFEGVEVTLGPSSLGQVVVEDGLSDGDVIALRDPSRSYRSLVPVESESASEGPSPTS